MLGDASFGGATPTLEKILAFLAHFGPFSALFEPLSDLFPRFDAEGPHPKNSALIVAVVS